jgi:hypothetical protein
MEAEKINEYGKKLVSKLIEKFDKLTFRSTAYENVYKVEIKNTAYLSISKSEIRIFDLSDIEILSYCPTAEDNAAYNLASLLSNIITRNNAATQALIGKMLNELDLL